MVGVPALSFKIEDRGGARTLERLRRSVRDLRPVWPQILEAFREQQRELFAGDGQEAGGWRPLSPAYARAKSRRHAGRRILRRSGALESATTGGSAEFHVVMQPLLLVAQVKTYYAAFIDQQRELSPLTRERVRTWTHIVDGHLRRAGRGS